MKPIVRTLAALTAALILCTCSSIARAVELPDALDASSMEAYTEAYVKQNESTTAAVSIAHFTANEVLLSKHYGYCDIENAVENSADTVMEWGSVSKLLVWVSVMQQVQAGSIALDADIRNYLPEGFLKRLRYTKPITMLNLMNHNAGWQNNYPGVEVESEAELLPLDEALMRFEPAQLYAPGETTAYSNWGAALAAYIVQRVTGEDYCDYVHENIFKPLGMEHTALAADLSDNAWVKQKRQELVCYYNDNERIGTSLLFESIYPCGSATGTLGDLTIFAQALLDPQSLLTDMSAMYEATLSYPDGAVRNAHGFWGVDLKHDILVHGGNMSGTSAMLAIDPEHGVGTVVMTNQASEQIYCFDYIFNVYGGWEYTNEQSHDAARMAGVYMDTKAPQSGYMKIDQLTYMLPFLSCSGDTVTIPLLGYGMTLVDNDELILDYAGSDMLVRIQPLRSSIMISTSSLDYVKLTGFEAVIKIGSVILLLVCAIGSLIGLAVRLIRRLMKRERGLLSLQSGLVMGACVLTLVDIVALYIAGSSAAGGAVITVLCILSLVLCVPSVWYAVSIALLRIKGEISIKTVLMKLPILITAVAVVLNVLYWQLYVIM